MAEYTPQNARVEVLTFKEGLLSPVAHDLLIRVQRFEITLDGGRVEADIDLSSLIVTCARKNGEDEPGTLSDADKEKIRNTIQTDVLHTHRYPEAHFEADLNDLDEGQLEGELELHGETNDVRARVEEIGGDVRVSVEVHQPDFNVTPYTAMFGTLRVRADVIIQVTFIGCTLDELRAN